MKLPDAPLSPEFTPLPVLVEPVKETKAFSTITSSAVVSMHVGKATIDVLETVSIAFIKKSSRHLPILNDASVFKRIYIACVQTYLLRGIGKLATIIRFHFKLNPYHYKDKLKDLTSKERLEQQQAIIKLLVDALFVYLKQNQAEVPGS